MQQLEFEGLRDFFAEHLLAYIHHNYHGDDLLAQACRYALEGKGKYVRPMLVLLCAHSLGGRLEAALIPATAIEMIHTYSLVHDDLPIFDNDDWRRGRLTVHKRFDEQTALLVGDALLTDAWQLLAKDYPSSDPRFLEASKRLKMISILSKASGSQGMVFGQILDMYWTKRTNYQERDLLLIHQHKTADLIAAACALGALAAGADEAQLSSWQAFGAKVGMAFQVIDDVIDDSEHTGKGMGKDREQGKLTYLRIMSKEKARMLAGQLTEEAFTLLRQLPVETNLLFEYTHHLVSRLK